MKKCRNKISGRITDYSVYRMRPPETALCISAGAIGGYIVFYIFFGISVIGLTVSAAGAAAAVFAGRKYFKEKRNANLMIQFRDFLESISSSLLAGQNISGAIHSAYDDICMQYGDNSLMAQEILIITNGMKNNINAEELINDFAVRSGQRDIRTFAETFKICSRTGGNMRKVISETCRTLSEKMQIQGETQVIASKGKNELRLMVCMPLVIVPMLKTLGESSVSGNNAVTVAVKVIGAAIIIVSYIIGSRITDIKF